MNQKDKFIDSVGFIKKEIDAAGGDTPKEFVIRSVLKKDLGMRYKKVNGIAWTANSHRNLILR